MGLINKIFGTHSERELKKVYPLADSVLALEEEYAAMSDEELREKTDEFKRRLERGASLDDILVEAFATVREAAWRVVGNKPFRVQIIGGIILHQGRIAEMKTGEGKTLTAVMPAYLNALSGEGVHIVTVNDYLAKFQSEWMGKIFRFLGMTVGLIIHAVEPDKRKAMYAADVTYGTNNEFGFDYLRDNMAIYKEGMVQRGHAFAIVDEVDSILIDEARTPLIISGQGDKSTEMYTLADRFASMLKVARVKETDDKVEEDFGDADYVVDEKSKNVTLTANGVAKAERAFNIENLSDPENLNIANHVNLAIKARGLMKRDVDYVVKDGEVIIVDEFTGRLMLGRRYSNGLHQAIEAKEGVEVLRESRTLATITFQNYFRMYDKLSGMTGTALTEQEEFGEIYKLDVIEIPTNRPVIRIDHPDAIYKNTAGKNRAIVKQIKECHAKGQPVLVGTVSIEKSEEISNLIRREGIPHNVLNAKHHEREADIIAQAGQFGAVTIATNMAGRGTDILLGGNAEYMARRELRKLGFSDEAVAEADGHGDTDDEEILSAREKFGELVARFKEEIKGEAARVIEAGGLYVLGTERHESRRIDNQLRGRSGRQGDPGESRFFISMEDDLMRLFGSERISGLMDSLGLDEDTPIDQKMITGAIEQAQKRIESKHYQSRKTVLEYDDVMNQQREIIYGQRQKVLNGEDLRENIRSMLSESCSEAVRKVTGEAHTVEKYQFEEIAAEAARLGVTADKLSFREGLGAQELVEEVQTAALELYDEKEREFTPQIMRELERVILLRTVDRYWMDHIDAMDELRQSVGLRGYANVDPKIAYRKEGNDMFEEMIAAIRDETARSIINVKIRRNDGDQAAQAPKREQVARPTVASHGRTDSAAPRPVATIRKGKKVGRNDPCPCGSGLKYKKCHGRYENGGAPQEEN